MQQQVQRAGSIDLRARRRPSRAGLLGGAVAAHATLGVIALNVPAVSTVHALVTLGLGLRWAASDRRIDRIALVAAYIVGAEVLWRMTGARVFWESGKYALVLLFGLGLFRLAGRLRSVGLPVAYFLVLIPSVLLTLGALGLGAKNELSFNLSGPLALAASVIFFSQTRMTWREICNVLWAMAIPVTAIASAALYGVLAHGAIEFTANSNNATSGGFGPTQVSAVLGLGTLICIMLALREHDLRLRVLAASMAMWFLGQSVFTFSRGGLLNVVVALTLFSLHFLMISGRRTHLVVLLGVGLLVGLVFVFPKLNLYSEGTLQERFTSLDSTGRSELVAGDLRVWGDHPFLGVGPGMVQYQRPADAFDGVSDRIRTATAHTEFTRLLSEHGLGGLAALVLLGAMAWVAYRRAPSLLAKAWVAALTGWSLAEMTHAAMRVAGIAFLFGLAMARIVDDARRSRSARVATSVSTTSRAQDDASEVDGEAHDWRSLTVTYRMFR